MNGLVLPALLIFPILIFLIIVAFLAIEVTVKKYAVKTKIFPHLCPAHTRLRKGAVRLSLLVDRKICDDCKKRIDLRLVK